MDIATLAFIFGCILVLVGIVGGGFELKELKFPKVGWPVRLIATITGAIFIGYGLHLGDKPLSIPLPTKQPSQPPAMPEIIYKPSPQQPSAPTAVHQETHRERSPAIQGVQGDVIFNSDQGGQKK